MLAIGGLLRLRGRNQLIAAGALLVLALHPAPCADRVATKGIRVRIGACAPWCRLPALWTNRANPIGTDVPLCDFPRSARPLLKWAGGKRQLLPELRRYPADFDRYLEPFVGTRRGHETSR